MISMRNCNTFPNLKLESCISYFIFREIEAENLTEMLASINSLVDCRNRQCLLALPLLAIKVLTLLKLATFGVLVKIHENS